ncbi:MAG: SHOCT domain-containing protein [Desulfuromonadales bacterium]|nr:SHOCT domain-containing protein [Desulfuromonadales bacterium]
MKMFRCSDADRLCSVVAAVLVLLMLSATCHASDVRRLWQSRDQFVALQRQDSSLGGAAILNDHPYEISPDRLTAILASIEVRSADGDKPEQLITNQSLEVLVPHMVQGFRQAAPGEDVTFAIIGLYKALHGFTKSPKVTTGRAFYKGGRLNIIFGLVQKDVNEREDRRLSPFTPGSRQKAVEGEWTLLPQSGQSGSNLVRKDWMIFSDEWLAPVAQLPVTDKDVPPSVEAAPVQSGKQVIDTRKPVDRLTTLNELKEKGLITEEEYRGKRLEIMNKL